MVNPLKIQFLSDAEEKEITELQRALSKALPRVISHDSQWMTKCARQLAVELWNQNVRAAA